MGVLFTAPDRVALVDSVTGAAFGPTFASDEHAADFLRWLREECRLRGVRDFRDVRQFTGDELIESYYGPWHSQRVDDEGNLRPRVEFVIDSEGERILPGMTVTIAGATDDDPPGPVLGISDVDGDVDDEGRAIGINPGVSVDWPDCGEECSSPATRPATPTTRTRPSRSTT